MITENQIIKSFGEIPQNAVISIYGSGEGGRYFNKQLMEKRPDIEVIYFLNSFESGELDGVEIRCIEDMTVDDINQGLVYVASVSWHQIVLTLRGKGIENFKVVIPNLLKESKKRKLSTQPHIPFFIQGDYWDIVKFMQYGDFSEDAVNRYKDFRDGLWKAHYNVIVSADFAFRGKTVLDYGCKYGQAAPIFFRLGIGNYLGIDVLPDYIESGKNIIGKRYSGRIDFFQTKGTLIPLQPESVDFVLMNEVISHVNPKYLEAVFLEISRVLKIEGILYISDCNSRANPLRSAKLPDFWEHYENGPDGFEGEDYRIKKCFKTIRKELIMEWYPGLPAEKLEYLATNTSGLFGEDFKNEVDSFIQSGNLIQRPYRRGLCPVFPDETGMTVELSFYPEELELTLARYGIEAIQMQGKTGTMNRPQGIRIKGVKKF